MENYDFKELLKEKMEQTGDKLASILEQIDKSQSWFYDPPVFGKIPIDVILKISEVLNFDFLSDYLKHIGKDVPLMQVLREPVVNYRKEEEITVQVSIKGDIKKLGKVLEKIKADTDREGVKIQ